MGARSRRGVFSASRIKNPARHPQCLPGVVGSLVVRGTDMAILADPFADFFSVSFPPDDAELAHASVSEVVHSAGAFCEREGVLRLGDGTVRLLRRFGVGTVGVSGAALSVLRDRSLFRDLLGVIAERPHRVTLLHATVDVAEDAPVALRRVYQRALRGRIRLTRKAVPVSQVSKVSRAGYVDGRQTGTVYLGKRQRDVSAKVYDKRNQLLDVLAAQHGLSPDVLARNDPGPLTRYELQFGRHVGVTLQDVDDPTRVFWHHAGDVLLPRPPGIAEWRPHSEGFAMPPRPEVDHVRQLKLLLENSPDVRRMMDLASKVSARPGVGERYLFGLLRRIARPREAIASGQ